MMRALVALHALLVLVSGLGAPGRAGAEPTYFVRGRPAEIAPLPAGVRAVGPAPGGLILAGPAAAIEALAERGCDLIRLADGATAPPALPAAPRPPRSLTPLTPPPEPVPDPVIADLVATMSAAEISATIQRLENFSTRMTYTDSCFAAAAYIADRLAALGLPVELDPFPCGGGTAYNVIAEKRGTVRPEEIYILSGHYDSMSDLPLTAAPGADDDASGVAAVIECARVLTTFPCAATVRFIAFAGEEQGLVGSRFYVENRVMPRQEDVRGVLNLDMIAYVHPNHPEWDANWYTDRTVSFALGEHVRDCVLAYTHCEMHLIMQSEVPYGSDHFWFAMHGYPAVLDIDAQFRSAPDWNPHYHTPGDLLATLDLAYATEMARGALAAAAELAGPQVAVDIAGASAAAASPALRANPNPFRETVTFEAGRGEKRLVIVDIGGRLVAALGGSGRLTWNGLTTRGRPAPPGVYFYALAPAGGRAAAGTRAGAKLVRLP